MSSISSNYVWRIQTQEIDEVLRIGQPDEIERLREAIALIDTNSLYS